MTYDEFKNKFNISLNEQQDAALTCTSGATLLLAVPGSGKTTVLVARLGYMIYCCDISASTILTMTYTVPATKEMRARFESTFGDEYSKDLEFRTINGVCALIINYYVKTNNSNAFDLLEDNSKLLNEIFIRITNEYPSEGNIKDLQTFITYVKNMQLSYKEIEGLETDLPSFAPIYSEYITEMKNRMLMDYDDQMIYAYGILLKYENILAYFQNRFKYICVDEAQDTSKIQHSIIRLLANKHNNIFMVGDEDQSIYGFRAAYPEALISFEGTYPDAKVLLLENNYRSTKEIVGAADRFIRQNQKRHEKHMATGNSQGGPIQRVHLQNRKSQYSYISELVKNCEYETAVLYRNNDSVIPLIDLLNRRDIGYRCKQIDSIFFTHYIVRDVEDIICFALDPYDSELFMRIYYKLNCGISKAAANEAVLNSKKQENGSLIFDLLLCENTSEKIKIRLNALHEELFKLKSDSPTEAINRIKCDIGYGAYLKERNADFEKLYILSVLAGEEKKLDGFLNRLKSLREIVRKGTSDSNSKLILSTIHSSKGLEYKRVLMIDMIDGILPSIITHKDNAQSEKDKSSLEEERRLFYVGVTRAQQELLLPKYGDYAGKQSFIDKFCWVEPPKSIATSRHLDTGKIVAHFSNNNIQLMKKDYVPNTRVKHISLGSGVVLSNDGIVVKIQFDNKSVKNFDIGFCLENGMLNLSTFSNASLVDSEIMFHRT